MHTLAEDIDKDRDGEDRAAATDEPEHEADQRAEEDREDECGHVMLPCSGI